MLFITRCLRRITRCLFACLVLFCFSFCFFFWKVSQCDIKHPFGEESCLSQHSCPDVSASLSNYPQKAGLGALQSSCHHWLLAFISLLFSLNQNLFISFLPPTKTCHLSIEGEPPFALRKQRPSTFIRRLPTSCLSLPTS